VFPGLFDELLSVNLFWYISFRMAAATLSAFLFALWWGGPTIRWLKRHRVGEQTAKTDSADLAEATVSKQDTPTMGGTIRVGLAPRDGLGANVTVDCRHECQRCLNWSAGLVSDHT
jgi:hypothetical protein